MPGCWHGRHAFVRAFSLNLWQFIVQKLHQERPLVRKRTPEKISFVSSGLLLNISFVSGYWILFFNYALLIAMIMNHAF